MATFGLAAAPCVMRKTGAAKRDLSLGSCEGEAMSVGPMNPMLYSLAGSSLAQTTGTDVLRARLEALAQQSDLEAAQRTEDALGIGLTDGEDNQTNERDGDGRTPWRLGRRHPALPSEETAEEPLPDAAVSDAGSDANDERGGHLDLSG
jgi:hypothetical protein